MWDLIIRESLFYPYSVLALPACHVFWQVPSFMCSMYARLCSPPPKSSCSSVLFILVVLYVKLQLLSLPSPFPILAAAGLFCTTPQVQVARATPPHPPKLLLLVIKVGAWWGWTPPRLSKECRLNVLLLYLQQPPPAAHHAPTHWSGCWCNFPLFVCHLSPALSFLALLVCQPAIKACLCLPLPFLLSVTSSLFFISSVVLSDQYTNHLSSPVLRKKEISFECQMICTCESFSFTTGPTVGCLC